MDLILEHKIEDFPDSYFLLTEEKEIIDQFYTINELEEELDSSFINFKHYINKKLYKKIYYIITADYLKDFLEY